MDLRGKSPKTEWLKEYVKDYPENSIIVFSMSTKYLKKLHTLFNSDIITGETPSKTRAQIVQKFQSGECKILFINTKIGGEGLTLSNADATIFLDSAPPSAIYEQAKERMTAVNINEVKPKNLFHIMISGTYDEELYAAVARNLSETDVINNYTNYIKRRSKCQQS